MKQTTPPRRDAFSSLIDYLLFLIAVLLIAAFVQPLTAYPQIDGSRALRQATATEGQTVSLSAAMDFDAAIDILSSMSQRNLGKLIVNPVNVRGPLAFDVATMHWIDAFETILDRKGLWYEEYDDHLLIVEQEDDPRLTSARIAEDLYREREVLISAVFFEANHTKLREMGTSWAFWNSDSTQSVNNSTGDQHTGFLEVSYLDGMDFGLDSLRATFKALENKQAGEILASPQLAVRSTEEGRIQIGSDYTITTQDFAGNTITQFFSTGSIILVTPTVHRVDTTTFVQLDVDVQRSAANSAGALGIEVKKTSAKTSVLLLDGEETVIGGLYSNEEADTREGIPFLKDLPWWFFGLRYVFGYESTSTVRRELVILLRADLTPTLDDRLASRRRQLAEPEVMEEGLLRLDEELHRYRGQYRDALGKE